jgi:hypothetical protein
MNSTSGEVGDGIAVLSNEELLSKLGINPLSTCLLQLGFGL